MSPQRRQWLAALAGSALPAVPVSASAAREAAVQRGRVLQFPRDHGAHLGAQIEWWYITGWLQVDGRMRGGFQLTFFRSRTGLADGLASRFAARQLLFAHAALTDLQAKRHVHAQRLARWSGAEDAPIARAAQTDCDVRVGGWTLRREGGSGASLYRASFASDEGAEPAFDAQLSLRATQPLLLQGEAGFSRKGPAESQASHYVSEPQLQASGRIALGRDSWAVGGRAWMDHEWSDALLHPQAVGWDWAGINLDDGSALTVFQLRRADGSTLWAGGSWRGPGAAGSAARSFGPLEVRFTAQRHWQSTATQARYPVRWQLDTPVGRFSVNALLDAQELDSRASTGTVYWEGLSELLDAAGRRVGLGYLELTGYAGTLKLG